MIVIPRAQPTRKYDMKITLAPNTFLWAFHLLRNGKTVGYRLSKDKSRKFLLQKGNILTNYECEGYVSPLETDSIYPWEMFNDNTLNYVVIGEEDYNDPIEFTAYKGTFEYAYIQLLHGRWLARNGWYYRNRTILLRDGTLHDQRNDKNGGIHYIIPCTLNNEDFLAKDWHVAR